MSAANLIGKEYGRWTVVGEAIPTPHGERKWLCRCSCGTERYVLERSLRCGGSVSCGCLRTERANKANTHDIAGQTFGELTALRPLETRAANGGVQWLCRCACGSSCAVQASLLVTGRKTHCGCKADRQYSFADVSGKRFKRLTALYPIERRCERGGRIWHCRCDCGSELDIPYSELAFGSRQSCGCQKKEHDRQLSGFLTYVAGTSLEHLKSKKLSRNNTTGVKGVYRIHGKYVAKIVFQGKQYYLGSYADIQEAAQARRDAEEMLAAGTLRHYARWKKRADSDPAWAAENPVQIRVARSASGFSILFLPEMDEAIPQTGRTE